MIKQALIHYIKSEKNDECYTPREAILPLLPYLPKDKIYWECTDFGQSQITQTLREFDFNVIGTHIKQGIDFLKDSPNFHFDIIITNPPYSLKTQFLQRCYELGKPFALLLPITTLEGVERGKLFRKYGIQLLVLNRRINFLVNKKRVWFNTSWFCWQLLPRDLLFAEVKRR